MFKSVKNFFTDTVGSKHDLVKSIEVSVEDKLVSPFYGYFITSWLVINWQIVYTALFLSQDNLYQKTGLLRSEYLFQQILPKAHSLDWFNSFIFLPFILTIIIFWLMPAITRPFYRKHLQNHISLNTIKIEELTEQKKAETELIEAEVEQATATTKAKKILPEIVWEKDYQKFKTTPYLKEFDDIKKSIYTHKGSIRLTQPFQEAPYFEIKENMLVYFDSNDIININNNRITLTPKGKYFMKRWSEEYI